MAEAFLLKKKFKIIVKWLAIGFSYLLVFLFGMYAHYNEGIRESLLSIKNLKNVSYSNYSAGQDAEPRTLELIIPDNSKTVIEYCRDSAMLAGILRDQHKIEVPALLVYSDDTLKIEMRLKGDYSDHWSGDKWSYRIKLKGSDRLFGMKSFSIQAPETRGFLNEWYYHKLMGKEDLIALRYGFVELVENGEGKGIYAIEESFDKQLLEFNDRREAPILKFDESILIDRSIINENNTYSQQELYFMAKVDVFKGNRTLKDSILYDQFEKGKFLLHAFRSKRMMLSEVMDVDRAARLFAIADITGGHHGLRWKNVRFYFNPVIGKLELIGFDSNSGQIIPDIYYNQWSNNKLGEFDVKAWKDVFFEDPAFVEPYFKYLKIYSDPAYLAQFHEEINSEMELYLTYMYSENSSYRFYLDRYIQNAALIAEKVEEYELSKKITPNEYYIEFKAERAIELGDLAIKVSFQNN